MLHEKGGLGKNGNAAVLAKRSLWEGNAFRKKRTEQGWGREKSLKIEAKHKRKFSRGGKLLQAKTQNGRKTKKKRWMGGNGQFYLGGMIEPAKGEGKKRKEKIGGRDNRRKGKNETRFMEDVRAEESRLARGLNTWQGAKKKKETGSDPMGETTRKNRRQPRRVETRRGGGGIQKTSAPTRGGKKAWSTFMGVGRKEKAANRTTTGVKSISKGEKGTQKGKTTGRTGKGDGGEGRLPFGIGEKTLHCIH